jgi:hypothetical protein
VVRVRTRAPSEVSRRNLTFISIYLSIYLSIYVYIYIYIMTLASCSTVGLHSCGHHLTSDPLLAVPISAAAVSSRVAVSSLLTTSPGPAPQERVRPPQSDSAPSPRDRHLLTFDHLLAFDRLLDRCLAFGRFLRFVLTGPSLRVHAQRYARARVHTHTHMCTHAHTHKHARAHTHTLKHARMHARTHTVVKMFN